jgi:hypothetical protein
VKHLRTFLLVLLTVLLPIRGGLAAAMLCPGDAAALHAAADGSQAAPSPHAGHGMDAPDVAHHAAHHAATQGDAPGDAPDCATPAGHATACQFCAGGCCVTPLACAPPTVAGTGLGTAAVFPALTVRVTARVPDGQDRPPRTI